MQRKRLWALPLAMLIIIALVIAGSMVVYRAGWSQGFASRQRLAEADGGERELARAGYVPHFVGHLGPLAAIGVLLLTLIAVGKILRLLAWTLMAAPWMAAGGPWGMHGRARGSHPAKHWRHHHVPLPPWCAERAQQADENSEPSEPESGEQW